MNQTEHLFTVLLAAGTGYAIAYGAKNVPYLIERWGYVWCYLLGLPIAMGLVVFAEMLTDRQDLLVTGAFATGFLFRMIKPNAR